VRRWQHRLEPLQKRVFGGCHLTRQPADVITGAGFEITELDVFYEDGVPGSGVTSRVRTNGGSIGHSSTSHCHLLRRVTGVVRGRLRHGVLAAT
jgi:hypothetical protein